MVDIGSSSSGEVIYLHPDGHRVTLEYAVPHVEVTLGESYANGTAPRPGTDAQGEPAPVAGGDVVIVGAAGSVITYTVPVMTASFDQRTDILTGTAPAGAWLQITLGGGSRHVQAGPDGAYAMDWSDVSPRLGEQGSVAHTDELGNQARLGFTVPYYNSYLPLVNKGE